MDKNINKWDYIKQKATENTNRGIRKTTTFKKIYAKNRTNMS